MKTINNMYKKERGFLDKNSEVFGDLYIQNLESFIHENKKLSSSFCISLLYTIYFFNKKYDTPYLEKIIDSLDTEELKEHFPTYCYNGSLFLIKKLLEKKNILPNLNNNQPIIKAAENYQVEMVLFLSKFKEVNIADSDNQLFINLCKSVGNNDDYYDIKIILDLYKNKKINPYAQKGQALINTVKSKRMDLIEIFSEDKKFMNVVSKRALLKIAITTLNYELLIKLLNKKEYMYIYI